MVSRLATRLRVVLAALGLAGTLAVSLTGGAPAVAHEGSHYLALGDSVPFGYITHDAFAYVNADNFIGFPALVGQASHLEVSNAACPGEATDGFLAVTGNPDGCVQYRGANLPLHVPYHGTATQEAYALSFLHSHHDTRLVTLMLGANDGFRLQAQCANDPVCIGAHLGTLLATVGGNINTILGDIRATGYEGVIVVVNYYGLDYSDGAGTALIALLNGAITGSAAAHGAVVADVFTAFQKAAAGAGGKTCHAGLLNGSPSSSTACDVHPSITGQKLIAETVLRAFDKASD
jgi:lysophospholipase L1-like esterase